MGDYAAEGKKNQSFVLFLILILLILSFMGYC